jgi:hypothetical protein
MSLAAPIIQRDRRNEVSQDLANHCIFCGEFGIVGHRSLRRNRKVATEVQKI